MRTGSSSSPSGDRSCVAGPSADVSPVKTFRGWTSHCDFSGVVQMNAALQWQYRFKREALVRYESTWWASVNLYLKGSRRDECLPVVRRASQDRIVVVFQNYGSQLVLLVGPFKEAHLAARMSDRCRCRTTSSDIATGMGHPVRLTFDGELRVTSAPAVHPLHARRHATAYLC